MKLRKTLIVILSVLLIGAVSTGLVVFAITNNSNQIKLTSPSDGQTVSIIDSSILDYWNAITEEDEIKALLTNEYSNKGAKSVSLSWDSNGSSFYIVKVADNDKFDNSYEERVFGTNPTLELYNLCPNTKYYWKVTGTYSNDTSLTGTFNTGDSPFRAVLVEGVSNVRDLGGYDSDISENSTLNYGLIYRGGRLNLSTSGTKITEVGIKTMSNQLGVKTEIDLRGTNDDDGQTTSEIPNAKYIKAPLGQYTSILDNESWEKCKEKGGVSGNYNATNKTILKTIFETLSNIDNYPIYLHCNAGADRTGTISMLINALLGVDETTLIKDFEVTTYSSYGRRLRSALNDEKTAFTDTGIMQNDGNNFVAMGLLIDTLKEYYTVDGKGSINDAVYNFLTTYVGISNKTIEDIRKIMIKDYTQSTEVKTLSNRQEILLTNSVKAIDIRESGVTLTTISSITIGNNSLGTDLTNLDFNSVSKYVYGEKDVIVIGNDESGKQYKIIVPTLIITREINDADALQEIIEYSSSNLERYGYFRLTNDISYSNKYCSYDSNTGSNLGTFGFRGILDGANHTISCGNFEWKGGMFGMIGAGAVIKNVNISAEYNGKQGAILGYTIAGATFDNVTFIITGSGATETSNNTGLLTKFQCVDSETDIGDKILTIELTKGDLNITLSTSVIVKANIEVVNFENTQDLILSNEKVTISLKDSITKDYSGYSNIHYIHYGEYNLGKNISDLDVSQFKDNLTTHGVDKTIDILTDNGEETVLIHISVIIVTQSITDFNTLKQCVMATQDGVIKNQGAYYILGADIILDDSNNQAWYYTDKDGNQVIAGQIWDLDSGFAGTLDGRGYKISGIDYSKMSGEALGWAHSYGLFGSLTNATIKNITFDNVIMGFENEMHSVLGMNCNNSIIDNVTINIAKTSIKAGKNANLVIAKQTKASTFNNLVINAIGFSYTTVVGEGYWSGTYGNNKYEDCKITCSGLTYIGGTAAYSPIETIDGFEKVIKTNKALTATFQNMTAGDGEFGCDESKLHDGTAHTNVVWGYEGWGKHNASGSVEIDFGSSLEISTIKVNALFDTSMVFTPTVKIEYYDETSSTYKELATKTPTATGTSAWIVFDNEVSTQKIKVTVSPSAQRAGSNYWEIDEIEVY